MKPDQRIKEYCNEHFTVSNGKLFCEACREQLNLKKSSMNNHVQSAKHKDRKVKLQEKEKQDQTIVQALQRYNETHHLQGETLPLEHQAYRIKVVRTFLCAPVPLNKLDNFEIFRRECFSLIRQMFSWLIIYLLSSKKNKQPSKMS